MKISNCHVDGASVITTPELVNGSYDNGDKAGGIIGYCVARDQVTNCSVKNATIQGYRDIGGIAGCSAGTLTGNTVDSTVTLIQDNTNGYKNETITTIGAIVGRNLSATLSDNTGEGVVTEVIK